MTKTERILYGPAEETVSIWRMAKLVHKVKYRSKMTKSRREVPEPFDQFYTTRCPSPHNVYVAMLKKVQ